MNIGDYLISLIERIAKRLIKAREPVILTGEVTATSPLKIKVKDDYEISEEHLILDVRCTEQWIRIPKDGNNEHAHTMDEALVDYQATGNMGAPVIFVPLGVEAYVDNPDFDTSRPATDDDVPGTPDNPRKIVNPAIPNPTTLPLKHTHTINPALPEICLWRGLKEGDKVRILRLEGGELHYVLERIETNISNDSEKDGGEYEDAA